MPNIISFLELSPLHLDDESHAMLAAVAADTLYNLQRTEHFPPGIQVPCGPADASSAPSVLSAFPGVWGWVCYAHTEEGLARSLGTTDVLLRIFNYARELGCDYVMFDDEAHLDSDYDVDLPFYRGEADSS